MKIWNLFSKKKSYPVTLAPSEHAVSSSKIERGVRDILFRLKKNGHSAYLVGGCVRDMMIGRAPKDFDIATSARPQQIKRLFRRCFIIGRRFRLAHVYIDDERFIEVSTFRSAVPPAAIDKGQPGHLLFGTIEEDAQRRDFTVNSLYYDINGSRVIDYTGGIEDIEKKVLRSIGDPSERFREDPVRMIRLARFAGSLGFDPSPKDRKAALKYSHLIKESNSSRLLEELYKILKCGSSAEVVRKLHELTVLKYWIPEIDDPAILTPLYGRLKAADIMIKSGTELSRTLLFTNLFYDLFTAGKDTGDNSVQNNLEAINKGHHDFAVRLRLPKKDWDTVRNNVARQVIFDNPERAAVRKKFMKKFVSNAYYPEAALLFELRAEADSALAGALKFWKEKSASREKTEQFRNENSRPRPRRRRSRGKGDGVRQEPEQPVQ